MGGGYLETCVLGVFHDERAPLLFAVRGDYIFVKKNLLLPLHDKLKVTSIVVTHDMISVYKIATRIAMMHQGRIVQTGGVDEIQRSADPVVQQFITGSSRGPMTDMNSTELRS